MSETDKFNFPDYNKENVIFLWEQVGFCLLQIQIFELTIEKYLTIVHKLNVDMSHEKIEKIEKIYNKFSKHTLGQLFKEVKDCEILPKDLDDRINGFIDERNWLVHRSRRENEKDVFNQEKFEKLVNRLTYLSDEALSLAKMFQEKSESYIISKGLLTKEQFDLYTQNYLDNLGKP